MTPSADSARTLAAYAVNLRYEDIPATALQAARACLVDAFATAAFGSQLPWSKIVVDASVLPDGPCGVPGTEIRTSAEKAALLGGVFAHGFELDSLRKPGAGVHPGATVALPALAAADIHPADHRKLITAIVAGCEIMFRVGAATLHTAEKRGFHAPGITGVFGSAVASGVLMGLSETQMAQAMGIAGSMSGGILAFAGSGSGGMIKRLHLGRAAESGITAAKLAAGGFQAPENIFETRFGVLETFCAETDASLLTRGLGSAFEIEKLCIKRYACHVTAQAPVERLAGLMAEHGFDADAIASIVLDVPSKIGSHHAALHPKDMALAQYSVPFMLAFSAFHDLDDPSCLTDEAIAGERVHELADRISLVVDPGLKGWNVRMRVALKDGRTYSEEASSFAGAPDRPLSQDGLRRRFMLLTQAFPERDMKAVFARLNGDNA